MACSTQSGLPMLGCCTTAPAGVVSVWVAQAFWHLAPPASTTEDVVESFLQTAQAFLDSAEFPSVVTGRHTLDEYTVNPGESGFYPVKSNYDCGAYDASGGVTWMAFFDYTYTMHPIYTNNLRFVARKVNVVLGGGAGTCRTDGELSNFGAYALCTDALGVDAFLTTQNQSEVGGEFELIPTHEFRRRGENFDAGGVWGARLITSPYGDSTIPGPCNG